MNVFSYSRRLAQGALLLCLWLVGANALQAQCGDFLTEPQPVTAPVDITLNLTNGGAAPLNSNVMLTVGFTINSSCQYEICQFSDFTSGPVFGLPYTFFCEDVLLSPATWYIRVADDPANPPAGPNGGPSNAFGNYRELHITVADMINPAVVCPANVVTTTSPANTCSRSVAGIFASASDNCGIDGVVWVSSGATITSGINDASGTVFNKGTSVVTYTVSDDNGNTATCSFSVTVNDNVNPVITCPTPAATYATDLGVCSVTGLNLPPASFSDNCGTPVVTFTTTGALSTSGSNNISGVSFPPGTTNVTYKATDGAGNTATCGPFAINVIDNQAPVITNLPAATNINTSSAPAGPDLCDAVHTWTHPSVTDNCGSSTLQLSIDGGAFVNVTPGGSITQNFSGLGVHTLVYRAIDMAAMPNTTTKPAINITVVDNVAPVVVLPADPNVNVPVSGTDCSKVITFTRPSIGLPTDCSSVTMTETVIAGSDLNVLTGAPAFNPATGGGTITVQFPTGLTQIQYCWIDAYGNKTCIVFNFFVDENVLPTAICRNVTRNLDANGQFLLLPSDADNGSSDNCSGLTLSLTAANGVNPMATPQNLLFDCADVASSPNTYTLKVTDAAGNTATANCTITIVDATLPTSTCPANVTVSTGAACSATGVTAGANLTYADNCSVSVVSWTADNGASPAASAVTGINQSLAGVTFQKGSTNVVYTVKDPSGNTKVCNFQVSVIDNVKPVLTVTTTPSVANLCAGGVIERNINTVSCNFIAGTPLWAVTANDVANCSNPVALTTTGGAPTGTYPQGDTPISIVGVDASGNITTCNFIVRVKETLAPNAICKDTTVNLSTAPITITAPTFNNGSNDNCTLSSALTLDLVNASGTVIPGINVSQTSCTNIPVILRVKDFNGNTDTCYATVKVNDNVAPTCSTKNATIFLNASGVATLAVGDINNGSSDNCTLAATPFAIAKTAAGLAANSQTLTYDCTERGAKTVFFKVTDLKGNTCTSVATVTIVDNIPPVGNGPADIAVSCDAVAAYLAQPVTITAVENCTFTVGAPTQTTVSLSGPTCANHYRITRSWVVTDAAGLTDLVQQVITVSDVVAPTVAITASTGTLVGPNHYQIKYSNDVPPFAYPADCKPSGSYSISATDNCAGAVSTSWIVELANDGNGPYPDVFGIGTTATANFVRGDNFITFTSIDACGNAVELQIQVTVVDDIKPIFDSYYQPSTTTSYCNQTQPLFTFSNTPGLCGYTFQWVRPWNGDITDCSSFTFAPESIVATTPTGLQTLSANFPWDPTNSLTQNVPISLSLPVGTTTFTYKVTDAANNSQTCSFSVKVNDTQVPTLSGPTTAILNSICPTQVIGDYTGLVSVTDNCGQNIITPLTQTPAPNTPISALTFISPNTPVPNPYDGSQFVVTITANDGTNVSVPRNITVTLDDNTAPVPTQNTLPDVTSNCGYIILMTPTALPNCTAGATIYGTPGGVAATAETVSGSNITSYRVTLPPGNPCATYFVTWSYNDGNGNVATQLQKVTLCPDIVAPTAKCKNATVTLSPTTATLTTADVNDGSFDTDNCNPFTLSLSKTAFSCADISPNNTGTTTVTLTATATNNPTLFSTCTAQVKVVDNIAPTIVAMSVPASITVDTCAIGYLPPAPANVTAIDNCSATVSLVQTSTQGTSGSTKYNYVITRTWTAKDVFGNTSTAVQTITVRDTKKPVFTPPSAASLIFNTAAVTTDCSATTTFNVGAFVSDCAPDGELSIVVNPPYFSLTDNTEVLPVGTQVVNFTVTDPSGNSATASITIVVKDATKPVASCINGISLALNANGQAIVTPGLINNQSADNCGPVTLQVQELEVINGDTIGAPASQLIFDCEEADNDTEYPIILWVKDGSGNFNFCETYVVIQDNVAPTIVCPAAVSIECSNDPAAFLPAALGNPTVTDNCPANVTTTYTDAPVTPGYACGNKVRTFKSVDLSGNTATCTQVITVTDTKPPVFNTLPPNDTISCDDPLVIAPVLHATDNCTPADSIVIKLTEVKSDSVGVCGKYSYKVTRTWTAKDKCGNVATHTQVVKVEDKTGPKFLGMPDTILILTANFPTSTSCTAPVALNAEQYFSDCATLNESTINSITFKPALVPAIVPTKLNVSGNYPVGNTKVSFVVTDACGNVGKDSVVVKVVDNSAPVVICNNSVEIALSNNGLATLSPSDVDLNSFDNCGIATKVLSKTQFDCEDLGINNVTLTVTDIHGNSNSCTVGIEVTAGANTGFTLTTSNTTPTYFGAANATAATTVSGGSNSFGYVWSNAATTASVSGLVAGTYTVTVTDLFTGCKQVKTIVVPDGPVVVFNVGNSTGAQNTVVKVPVNVDNFQEISGFTFTVNVPNAVVGSIVTPIGITNINAGLGAGLQASVNGNSISVLYLNAQGANVSLPNGSLLFNLCVQLSGAPLGTTSTVDITSSPVQFTVLRTTGTGPITIPANQVSGSVQITQGLNEYDVLGDITPWQNPAAGVPNVDVDLTGPATPLAFLTTASGQYAFNNIVANTNTTTVASKSQAGNSKIDIIDQGLLLKHIFATATAPSPLTSPYQRVAADVNFDGQINIIDFALIQRLLLGTVQHLEGANAKDWVFIPKSYTFPANTTTPFPNPVYPALPVFPQSILHTPLIQDQIDDDFIGVRLGDLNGDAPLNLQQNNIEERDGGTMILKLQDRTITAGETVKLAFKAKDFTNRYGYQTTLAFDPNVMELTNIEAGAIPGLDATANFGTTLLSDGLLSTAWVSLDPTSVSDNETLFTLEFKATSNINSLSQVIHTSGDIVAPMAINENGEVEDVAIEFTGAVTGTQNTLNDEYVLYQNQPNPFRSSSVIGFRLPASERCVVKVFASNGLLVKTFIGNYEKGYNTIQVRNSDLGGAGVYYYELSTSSFSDRRKMILID